MSGETENNVSSWTVDTLHELMLALLAEREKRHDERLHHQQSEWHEHLDQARREVQEALTAADKAVIEVDRRHNEQFHALDRAVMARFDAEHNLLMTLASERQIGIDAAFAAQQAAVSKAEIATEKRFESVNEFRAQLTDQAGRFVTRNETDSVIAAVRSEMQSAADRNAERIQDLTDRVNRAEGKGAGFNSSWIIALGVLAALGTIVSLYVAFRAGA